MSIGYTQPPAVFRVSPYGVQIATSEKWPLSFDCAPLLTGTQTVSNPVSVFWDVTNEPVIADLSNEPYVVESVDGTLFIVQEIVGSVDLEAGHVYQLFITFNADSETTPLMVQAIACPF